MTIKFCDPSTSDFLPRLRLGKHCRLGITKHTVSLTPSNQRPHNNFDTNRPRVIFSGWGGGELGTEPTPRFLIHYKQIIIIKDHVKFILHIFSAHNINKCQDMRLKFLVNFNLEHYKTAKSFILIQFKL